MKLHILAAACGLLLAPTGAFAHGEPPAPSHGGQVVEDSSEHWIELVASAGGLTVYVLDEGKKPIPSTQLGGKATVLVGGKSQVVMLTPGPGNSLGGKLAAPATGKMTTVLSLTVSGKPAQARFASTH